MSKISFERYEARLIENDVAGSWQNIADLILNDGSGSAGDEVVDINFSTYEEALEIATAFIDGHIEYIEEQSETYTDDERREEIENLVKSICIVKINTDVLNTMGSEDHRNQDLVKAYLTPQE